MLIYVLISEHDIVPGVQIQAFRGRKDCNRRIRSLRRKYGKEVKCEIVDVELE